MVPSVRPIILSQLDWPTILSAGRSELGRNLGDSLDRAGEKPGSFPAFISILESFAGSSKQPRKAVREAFGILAHISFGFLIRADTPTLAAFVLLTANHLAFTLADEKTLLVASGNLAAWQRVVAHHLGNEIPPGLRIILNACYLYFEQAGLGDLWAEFSKRPLDNGSFSLVRI